MPPHNTNAVRFTGDSKATELTWDALGCLWLPRRRYSHLKYMMTITGYDVSLLYLRKPAEPMPPPIKEPPSPMENPDAPVREPDPEEPEEI
jgi:hypothetical protein